MIIINYTINFESIHPINKGSEFMIKLCLFYLLGSIITIQIVQEIIYINHIRHLDISHMSNLRLDHLICQL